MRYLALATDFDGTLAHDGVVDEPTIKALERLANSGRKLILVTGREIPDLQNAFSRLDLFDRIVAENGAVLYNPGSRETKVLALKPPESFISDLRQRGVANMSVGDVIVATWQPFEHQAIEAIRDAGLELQVIFNKEAVMILPAGVNKSSGLSSALEDLKLSRHNVIGIGDAENDHAFLESCEASVAVANAIPALKERADYVTEGARGAGVTELIHQLMENDASSIKTQPHRSILVGKSDDGEVRVPAYGRNILICGQSGSGKSTVVLGLLERILQLSYQICLIDPEGDYENLPDCRTVGDEKRAPSVEHVMQVLADPAAQVIVNLVGVAAPDRPALFGSLVTQIQHQRLTAGRPHWLVIDEAHHVLPAEWAFTSTEMTEEFRNLILITVHPEHVSQLALKKVNTVLVIGREPMKLVKEFADAAALDLPDADCRDLARGEAFLWFIDENWTTIIRTEPSRNEHQRHRRKYAEGQLEPERQFHFRGPDNRLDLRAHNLNIFVQIAEGIDTDTWLFHRKRGDYSRWLRDQLKDPELASELEQIEKDQSLSDAESRKRVTGAILQRYTAPA